MLLVKLVHLRLPRDLNSVLFGLLHGTTVNIISLEVCCFRLRLQYA